MVAQSGSSSYAPRPAEDHRYDPLDHHYVAPSHTAAQEVLGSSGAGGRALGPTHEIHNSIGALCAVIQAVIQVKHGLPLDGADLVRKVAGNCKAPSSSAGVLEPIDLVAQLNAQPSLRFCTKNRARLASLWLDAHPVDSFEDLQVEVAKWPGVARAVAILRPMAATASSSSSSWQAVAVGNRDSSNPRSVLVGDVIEDGYSSSYGQTGERRLRYFDHSLLSTATVPFREADLWNAVLVDVQVLQVEGLDTTRGLVALPPPPIHEDYAQRGLATGEHGTNVELDYPASDVLSIQGGYGTSRYRAQSTPPRQRRQAESPWSPAPSTATQLPERTSSPSRFRGGANGPPWMARIEQALSGGPTAARSDQVLAALQELSARLSSPDPSEVMQTRSVIDSSGIHSQLVACVQRASDVPPGPRSRWREGAIGVHASRCIGLDSLGNPRGRDAFLRQRAVPATTAFLQRWQVDEDAARTAVFAMRQLVTNDQAAVEALTAGAPRSIHSSMQRHPRLPDLRENGSQALDMLAKHHRAWAAQYDRFRREVIPAGPGSMSFYPPAPMLLPGASVALSPRALSPGPPGSPRSFLQFPTLVPPRLNLPTPAPVGFAPSTVTMAPPLILPSPPRALSPPGTPQLSARSTVLVPADNRIRVGACH
mmetsp:Transcript_10018/g.22471  ORF Transcript_10018/g.22471 Transcript_10018/m.22471 type:complete len:651 (-) Transcript_10018:146-2098(-)